MTIQKFSIEYDAINSKNTFTNGDSINGRIIVEVSKETRIQALLFTAKGKARVCWSEYYGQHNHRVYWADEKYYSIKHHILRESRQDGTEVVGKGRHVFPFTFQIPERKIPSTFKSDIGRIVHKLKAELKQSMKFTKKAKTHFTFVSKADMDVPGLMEPQYGAKDKSLKVFASGNVSMDVQTKKMGYKQGEPLKVKIDMTNHSTRSVKPKFILYEKRSFFAQGRRRVSTHDIIKEKAEDINASSGRKTVTKVITIPRDLPPSILNCSIIKLEYRLKVYLDIKCASDPVIKLPIVILPEHPDMKVLPAAADYGFEAFGNPNQPIGGTRQSESPPPYGAYALYPTSNFGNYKTPM